ncbi:hypothetical protein HDU93_004541 [Gonapodya sp. JEL0774]|nr:hypothetical protein HDU93_004541 [Gonapodya sp. JEL0774]
MSLLRSAAFMMRCMNSNTQRLEPGWRRGPTFATSPLVRFPRAKRSRVFREEIVGESQESPASETLDPSLYAQFGIERTNGSPSLKRIPSDRDLEHYLDPRAHEENPDDEWYIDKTVQDGRTSGQDRVPHKSFDSERDTAEGASREAFVPLYLRNLPESTQRELGIDPSASRSDSSPVTLPENLPETLASAVDHLSSHPSLSSPLVVLDVRSKCDWTDYMIVAESSSARGLYTMASEIRTMLKTADPSSVPPPIEGLPSTPRRVSKKPTPATSPLTPDLPWLLIDTAPLAVFHFMSPGARRFYDVESMWGRSPEDPIEEFFTKDDDDEVEEAWGRWRGLVQQSETGRG